MINLAQYFFSLFVCLHHFSIPFYPFSECNFHFSCFYELDFFIIMFQFHLKVDEESRIDGKIIEGIKYPNGTSRVHWSVKRTIEIIF